MSERRSTTEELEAAGWQRVGVFRAFSIRDFRLLWTGLSVSLFGDGLFLVALAWQTYELSSSPSALAMVGLAWTVPMVVLLLFGGVISDRYNRRRIMIVSDVLRGSAVAAIGVLSVLGELELWHLYLLAGAYGVGDALFPPAFGALVPELVPEELLVQANAVDAFMRPLMLQLVGPAVGGVVVATIGAGGAFLTDAGTFAVSATVLLLIRFKSRRHGRGSTTARGVLSDIHEGLRFVRSQTWLWGTLVMAAVSLLVYLGPFEVLLPFLVKHELAGSATDLGMIFAAAGVGGIVGSALAAQGRLPRRVVTVMYLFFALAVCGPIVYGLATEIWQMMVAAFVTGIGASAGGIIWVTLMQRHVPGELLGRVTSLDWLISTSLLPISYALTGPVAAEVGARETLVGAGVVGVAVTLVFLLLPGLRDLERGGRRPEPSASGRTADV